MTDRTAPTWENQLWHAEQMSDDDLRPHADVSRNNRHRCTDCFCCAALHTLERRQLMRDALDAEDRFTLDELEAHARTAKE